MQKYCGTGVGELIVDPDSPDRQTIFSKDGVTVRSSGGTLKPGVMFNVESIGMQQIHHFDIFFQDAPGEGAIGVSDEALLAILYHRMRLKHSATGNDQWLEAAKYLEDVEESIHAAGRKSVPYPPPKR